MSGSVFCNNPFVYGCLLFTTIQFTVIRSRILIITCVVVGLPVMFAFEMTPTMSLTCDRVRDRFLLRFRRANWKLETTSPALIAKGVTANATKKAGMPDACKQSPVCHLSFMTIAISIHIIEKYGKDMENLQMHT